MRYQGNLFPIVRNLFFQGIGLKIRSTKSEIRFILATEVTEASEKNQPKTDRDNAKARKESIEYNHSFRFSVFMTP
jgi:hypothetical protein